MGLAFRAITTTRTTWTRAQSNPLQVGRGPHECLRDLVATASALEADILAKLRVGERHLEVPLKAGPHCRVRIRLPVARGAREP